MGQASLSERRPTNWLILLGLRSLEASLSHPTDAI